MSTGYCSKRFCSLLALALGLVITSSVLAQKGKGGGGKNTPPVLWSVTLITNTLGGVDTLAGDFNSFGEIVGSADNAIGDRRAFLYTTDTGMVDLNSLLTDEERAGWILESAKVINEFCQIAGRARKDGMSAVYLFDLAAVDPFVILPRPPGSLSLNVKAMNNIGEIVGIVRYENNSSFYLFSPNGTVTDIGDWSGVGQIDINDLGQIVTGSLGEGYRLTPDGNGGYIEEFFPDLEPREINNSGVFAGRTEGKSNSTVVFRYSDHLDILPDGKKQVIGWAVDINSDGDVGINSHMKIYTDYQNLGQLILDDHIHPDDVELFTENMVNRNIRSIGERDASGFVPIIVGGDRSIWHKQTTTRWRESFLLIPTATGN